MKTKIEFICYYFGKIMRMRKSVSYIQRFQFKQYSSFATIKKWAEKDPEWVTIDSLIQTETCDKSYLKKLVSNEAKNRIATQIIGLESLPYGICKTPSVNKVILEYLESFNEIKTIKKDSDIFYGTLDKVLKRHQNVMKDMAVGIYEWKYDMKQKYELENFNDFTEKIDQGLNDFYHKRTSTRLIISNYIGVSGHDTCLIDPNVNIPAIINSAYEDAQLLCEKKYDISPPIKVIGGFDGNFSYIPDHFYHIIHELLKNSLEATTIQHIKKNELPPVTITISNYDNKPLIRVHDQGIGLSPPDMDFIWSYFFSNSSDCLQNIKNIEDLHSFINTPHISGFGYGMPMSKLLIEYFGGSMTFNSIKNKCSDVYLYF